MVPRVVIASLFASLHASLASNPFLEGGGAVTVYEGPTECDHKDQVKGGHKVHIHYTGTIDKVSKTGTPGEQFDSTRDQEPFAVVIGQGRVIQGFDRGLLGLCKGSKAIVVIPPEFGYGEEGANHGVPSGATLNYDVEVMDVDEQPAPPKSLFKELDENEDGQLSPEEIKFFFSHHGGQVPPGLMEEEDKDGDGFISEAEFHATVGGSEEL